MAQGPSLELPTLVSERDVGRLAGLRATGTRLWRQGQKNVADNFVLLSRLARSLGVEVSLLQDIAQGNLDSKGALQELDGYGDFSCSAEEHKALAALAEDIVKEAAKGKLPPIYASSLLRMAKLKMRPAKRQTEPVLFHSKKRLVTWSNDYRPIHFVRFLQCQTICRHGFIDSKHLGALFTPEKAERLANVLALLILMPPRLFSLFVEGLLPQTADLAGPLSERFWVSRSLVNTRLKDFVAHGN
jgi:hypothetical protein